MKKIQVILTFLLCLFLSSLSNTTTDIKDWSPVEQELWNLEQNYMQNYKDKNLDSLTHIYHKDFIGWPQWSSEPVDVSTAKNVLQKPSATTITGFKIRPQKILLYGTIAIVYYYIDVDYEKERSIRTTVPTRIIHTWINENGKWHILGGMSAN